ncbi:MAG: hypothetical protein JKX81_14885 [Arenicella sp.]|nr:hypothetical protein [Arenicella sp.]
MKNVINTDDGKIRRELTHYSVPTIVLAGCIQIVWLLWVSNPEPAMSILVSLLIVLFLLGHWYVRRQNGITTQATLGFVAFTLGGLGMLVGASIDAYLLAQELCISSGRAPLELVYLHHQNGPGGLNNFAIFGMLLFCIAACQVFCPHVASSNYQLVCRHFLASIVMVSTMLALGALLLFIIEILNLAVLSQMGLGLHHLSMCIGMALGASIGYRSFDKLAFSLT